MGCFVPSLQLDDRAHRAGLPHRLRRLRRRCSGPGVAAAPPGRGRWLALAGTWTLAELLRWSWPFGGVPLANLAIGQVAGPLAPVLRVGGALLLLARHGAGRPGGGRGGAPARGAPPAGCWSPVVAGAWSLVVIAPRGHDGRARPRSRWCRAAASRAPAQTDTGVVEVFERHVDATALVRAAGRPGRVARGRDRHRRAASSTTRGRDVVGDLARELGAPMVVGTVEDAGPEPLPQQRGARRRRRQRRRPLRQGAPGALRRVRARSARCSSAVAGDALPDRDARDRRAAGRRSTCRAGSAGWPCPSRGRSSSPTAPARAWRPAPVWCSTPPTASSFTGTIVQTQQVASSRMRAIETAAGWPRSPPPGFSAVVDDHGRVLERTSVSERRVIQREVQLREGLTIYTRLGNAPRCSLAAVRPRSRAGWAAGPPPGSTAARSSEVDRAGDLHRLEEGAVVGDEQERAVEALRAPTRAARWPRGRGGWSARRARGS